MGWFDRILRSCSHRAAFILRLSTSYLFRLRQEKIVKGDPPHGPHQRYFPCARQQLTEAEQGWKAETSPWGTIDRNCVCSIVSGSLRPWASVSIWFQLRILEGAAILPSWGSFWPSNWTQLYSISFIDRQILTTELSGKPLRCNRLSSNPSLPKGWEEGRKAEINPSKVALQIFSECTVAALLKPLQFWCLLRTLQWCFKGLNVD